MKKFILFILGFFVLIPSVYAQSAMVMPTAKAEIKNTSGEVIGSATFTQEGGSVKIKIEVSKLSPGKHGMHIHDSGKCDGSDFKSAGPHFNPNLKKHGHKNPEGAHAGDFPNLEVGTEGKATLEFSTADLTLLPAPNSLLRPGGTSIMIHEKEDDEKTDPAGDSGGRIACGVIV